MDPNNAYLDIQSGSGGTEAQDWAEMLMRMYLKWGESKGFETEVIEISHELQHAWMESGFLLRK